MKMQDYEFVAYYGDYLTEYKERVEEMLEKHDWDTIVSYMDDEIREELHSELAPCNEKIFLLAYMARHTEKYGDDFSF